MTTESLASALDRLQAAKARLEDISHSFAEIDEDPDARYAGADPAGAVTVELDGGGVVHAVRVAANWRESVGVDGLGGAVLVARAAAAQARVDAWSKAADEAHERIESGTATTSPPAGAVPGRSSAPTAELLSALLTARAERDAYANAVATVRGAEVTGTTPDGKVRATFAGGLPVRVEIDRDWLTFGSPAALGAGIRTALESGRAQREASAAQLREEFPGVAALRALVEPL